MSASQDERVADRALTPSVEALDLMPVVEVHEALLECGGAPRWVSSMLAKRPFRTAARMHALADDVWRTLGPDDWRAAFARHPRIGAEPAAVQGALGRAWSAREQEGVAAATHETRDALAAVNHEYEARFGHIYIVCAAGKSADELLRIARTRLAHEPDAELKVAAEELRQIMQLRLAKLLAHDTGAKG